jgi:SNF2 family DNA or RNA helicase
MKAEDYLPMEKPNYLRRYIELDEPTRKMKDEFEQNYVLKFDSGTVIEAINGAALSNKLLQFSSGAVYDEEKRIHPIHDEKIEDLKQLVDELDGEPIMVAYWFQSSLQRLKKSFPKATVMDKGGKCVDAWNAGKIEMLLIHPASAGHGLNMQKGPGHDLYFFDIPWSRELYEQIIGRLARQGQKRIVRVYHALVRDTLDEIVLQALNDKGAGQEALFRYIKKIRDRMRRKA